MFLSIIVNGHSDVQGTTSVFETPKPIMYRDIDNFYITFRLVNHKSLVRPPKYDIQFISTIAIDGTELVEIVKNAFCWVGSFVVICVMGRVIAEHPMFVYIY